MYRAGIVSHLAGGVLVARTDDAQVPDIGDDVINERLDTVGQVVDIFGPVDHPYLAITPDAELKPATVLNEPVYVRE